MPRDLGADGFRVYEAFQVEEAGWFFAAPLGWSRVFEVLYSSFWALFPFSAFLAAVASTNGGRLIPCSKGRGNREQRKLRRCGVL